MPEEREIAPCPFCGGPARVLDECDCYSVMCDGCDAEGPLRKTEIGAVSAWNKRHKEGE